MSSAASKGAPEMPLSETRVNVARLRSAAATTPAWAGALVVYALLASAMWMPCGVRTTGLVEE